MKTRAWYTATAIAFGAVLATACVVSTSDDNDDDIADLNDDTSSAGSPSTSDDDSSTGGESTGGTANGGAANTGGTAGAEEAGGTGGTEPAGTCDTTMPEACGTCLEDSSKGFTTVWNDCKAGYPCCEEAARYALCMPLAVSAEPPADVNDVYGGVPEDYCADAVLAGLDESDLSEEFYSLSGDAFSVDADPSCYAECFFSE